MDVRASESTLLFDVLISENKQRCDENRMIERSMFLMEKPKQRFFMNSDLSF